jgi:hypothetical protein
MSLPFFCDNIYAELNQHFNGCLFSHLSNSYIPFCNTYRYRINYLLYVLIISQKNRYIG